MRSARILLATILAVFAGCSQKIDSSIAFRGFPVERVLVVAGAGLEGSEPNVVAAVKAKVVEFGYSVAERRVSASHLLIITAQTEDGFTCTVSLTPNKNGFEWSAGAMCNHKYKCRYSSGFEGNRLAISDECWEDIIPPRKTSFSRKEIALEAVSFLLSGS